ncbi:MAG: thiol reductase thioredoxin [Bacteroidales bacterium]|nr:thiol reductase thioredoxin [Bacteroidales bacterium]
MTRLILFIFAGLLMMTSCQQSGNVEETTDHAARPAVNEQTADIKPEFLTAKTFREKVWDYQAEPAQWVYKGEIPCIIDFYADWCKPCRMVAPIMDDLADIYSGRVKVYKIDTDKERELATVFQITSIPAILFSPMEGKPALQPGALSKENYISIIDEFVLGISNDTLHTSKKGS